MFNVYRVLHVHTDGGTGEVGGGEAEHEAGEDAAEAEDTAGGVPGVESGAAVKVNEHRAGNSRY